MTRSVLPLEEVSGRLCADHPVADADEVARAAARTWEALEAYHQEQDPDADWLRTFLAGRETRFRQLGLEDMAS